MRVFFAVPAYRGIQCGPMLDSLEATYSACQRLGMGGELSILEGNPYIQAARNELVGLFLQSGADCLFFLDDDISWSAEDALSLISMEDEVVAGIYPFKTDEPSFPVVIRTDLDHRPIVREDGCIYGAALPTGFLRIKRSVIERMHAAYPDRRYVSEDRELYDLFPQGLYNGQWVGEDYAFCRLWSQIGGEMMVVPNITFRHHSKNKVWEGNYHEFLLRQPGGSGCLERGTE